MQLISLAEYRRAVSLRDLSDPRQGPHAMQLELQAIVTALSRAWGCRVVERRANPVVPVEDNYDRLHYPAEGAARDARYTRYVSERLLLRTQTSAMIPELLGQLAPAPSDTLLVCPGLVYRRDVIDRLHTGEPHQVDLWRIRTGQPLGLPDLEEMIAQVVAAALPGLRHRTTPAEHPYTQQGRQVDVCVGNTWVEIGECGLALPALLREAGLEPASSGLAMGLGLDRLLMLRKGIDDIRLLRSTDPRALEQLQDLAPWRPLSRQPPVTRDLSLVVEAELTEEELGDRVRRALGDEASCVESIAVCARTPHGALPVLVREWLGIAEGQDNLLLRLVLRHLERTLTTEAANTLRNRVYAALHRGSRAEWA
jgi:phenylalanyl-tRNA synthetase alpha chain